MAFKKKKPVEKVHTPAITGGVMERPEGFSRRDLAAAQVDLINAQYKRTVIQTGAQFVNTGVIRRPTGLTSLDVECAGGIPVAGITQIIGPDGVGKDYLTNLIMSQVQRVNGDESTLAACHFETPWDKDYGRLCNVRVSDSPAEIAWKQAARLERGEPALTQEEIDELTFQIGTFSHILRPSPEETFNVAIDLVARNVYQVISVNSIGSFVPDKEMAKELGEDAKVAVDASLVTAFMKRLWATLNTPDTYGRPNTTSVIVLNQVRADLKAGMYEDNLSQGGGNALKHGKLLDLHLTRGPGILKVPTASYDSYTNPQVGKEVRWKIAKAKAGAHEGPRGSYSFYYGKNGYGFGADLYADLIKTAKHYEVLEAKGNWLYYGGKNLGNGEHAATQTIVAENLFDIIRDSVFRAADVTFLSKEPF